MKRLLRSILLSLVFHFFILTSNCSLTEKISSNFKLPEQLQLQIDLLRENGKEALRSKQYHDAIQYYSAVLQLVSGKPGEQAAELRRRCGLTLAECEIRTKKYYQAIARCSDVINEAANYISELPKAKSKIITKRKQGAVLKSDQIVKVLATAYFRRALSLKALKKNELAILDLKASLNYQPGCEIASKELRGLIGKAKSKLNKEVCDTLQPEVSIEENRSNEAIEEKLRDFTEDCMVSFPRLTMTMHDIHSLTHPTRKEAPVAAATDLSSLFASDQPSTPDLSQLQSSFDGLSTFRSILSLAGPMIGIDGIYAQRLIEIIESVAKVWKLFSSSLNWINCHREVILLAGTLIWLAATYFSNNSQ